SRHHVICPALVVRGLPAKLRQQKIFIAPFFAPSVRRSFSLSPREEEE
ncbi:type VI secretion protein, partial [Klebsiella pneumoniae]|nr:type VI secretion protein [Klebsiella pneumoniae]